MLHFELKHPQATQQMLGYLPSFLSVDDPRSAKEQFNDNYRHGGGWSPYHGHTMLSNGLRHPGDPVMRLLAEAKLRDETIRFYEGEWVAIVQADGSYEIARMD